MATYRVKIEGTAPLLMHNGALADPLNPTVRAMKKLTGKKTKKTDDDIIELARLEFVGGLYLDDTGAPCITSSMLQGMMVNGAADQRKGKDFTADVSCPDDTYPLIYTGPKTADELWDHGDFVHTVGVKVAKARVMRTRPKFKKWAVEFTVKIAPHASVSAESLLDAITIAGQRKGIGDFRPRFGRFTVTHFSKV